MQLIPAYIILQITLFAVLLWSRIELRRFLGAHRAIGDYAALSGFKDVVRLSMLCALAFLVCGVGLLVWGVYLAMRYGMTGLAVVVVSSIPSIFLAFGTKRMENRARSLECSDPALAGEYRHISDIWLKRALPIF